VNRGAVGTGRCRGLCDRDRGAGQGGGSLRYRGVDIEDLVGKVPYEEGLGPAGGRQLRSRSFPRRAASAPRTLGRPSWSTCSRPWRCSPRSTASSRSSTSRTSRRAPTWPGPPSRPELRGPVGPRARAAVGAAGRHRPGRHHSPSASSSAGAARPTRITRAPSTAYWISAAEHGMNASTFTARVIASTGADCAAALSGAVGALSGPLHGGAPSRVLKMLDDVEREGDAVKYVKDLLDRGERLMGFGHRVNRAEDPRARVLRRTRGRGRRRALRGRPGAGVRGARRAQGPQARPRPGHQRGVLVGGRARHRGGTGRPLHSDVHLCARGRLVGAHHGAEARGPAHPADRQVRRRGAPPRQRGRLALRPA